MSRRSLFQQVAEAWRVPRFERRPARTLDPTARFFTEASNGRRFFERAAWMNGTLLGSQRGRWIRRRRAPRRQVGGEPCYGHQHQDDRPVGGRVGWLYAEQQIR